MEFWPEYLASSWGREFVAGGIGGMAGVMAGHPFDTLKTRIQQPSSGAAAVSAVSLLRRIVASEGPLSLYKGMSTPLTSVALQNAVSFQTYALLSRAFDDKNKDNKEPPSYKSVAAAGVGAGAIQTGILTPVELIKIRLQVDTASGRERIGPLKVAKSILQRQGLKGLYRGLGVTVLRDAPAHGVYFWTYEYSREVLHPGCRKTGEESLFTMLSAGGLAGVASWVVCYPLDVVKSRLQAQDRYSGMADCLKKTVKEEGFRALWRGLGTAVARAFVVNGAIFSAYELALRCFFSQPQSQSQSEEQVLNPAI